MGGYKQIRLNVTRVLKEAQDDEVIVGWQRNLFEFMFLTKKEICGNLYWKDAKQGLSYKIKTLFKRTNTKKMFLKGKDALLQVIS